MTDHQTMSHQRSMFGVLREAILSRDPVTGTLCRSAFERAVFSWIGDGAGARRPSSSLLLVSIDRDARGAAVAGRPTRARGTSVLRAAADALAPCVRATDIIGRLDDETLGVLLPSTPAEQARAVAFRIRDAVAQLHTAKGEAVTASIGVATGLLADPWGAAHDALEDAQLAGGDRVIVAQPPRLRQSG